MLHVLSLVTNDEAHWRMQGLQRDPLGRRGGWGRGKGGGPSAVRERLPHGAQRVLERRAARLQRQPLQQRRLRLAVALQQERRLALCPQTRCQSHAHTGSFFPLPLSHRQT